MRIPFLGNFVQHRTLDIFRPREFLRRHYRVDLQAFAASPTDVPLEERQSTDLHRLFYENDKPIVHKWRHYLKIYERHFASFRARATGQLPLRLLEIGVWQGGSLRLWRKYFGPSAVLFGIDIDPNCAALDGQYGSVRIGSQSDQMFLRTVIAEMGGIDIVIDDGSHNASDQRAAFETLFPLLAQHGLYICEDLHTAYWPGDEYEGGYRRPTSFIEIAKNVVDDMHADFHNHPQMIANAHRSIAGIYFYNSMVVIEKDPQDRPAHIMSSGDP